MSVAIAPHGSAQAKAAAGEFAVPKRTFGSVVKDILSDVAAESGAERADAGRLELWEGEGGIDALPPANSVGIRPPGAVEPSWEEWPFRRRCPPVRGGGLDMGRSRGAGFGGMHRPRLRTLKDKK